MYAPNTTVLFFFAVTIFVPQTADRTSSLAETIKILKTGSMKPLPHWKINPVNYRAAILTKSDLPALIRHLWPNKELAFPTLSEPTVSVS
ncbi:hypothetical protein BaRGS_00017447 [Batillaria attramentaria]|uniref:Uncharacterized protein n=1 Tax=Batillaria attramentaria TaxID=370345 RepID=A0ABD0KWF6_9CAEN